MNGFETRRPVIVGVDRSEASHWAVRWAADEAAGRHLPLRLLHAQEWPVDRGTDVADHPWAIGLRAAGEAVLDTARMLADERHPGLEITSELAEGRPVRVLREAADEAAQLVLGVRRLSEAHSALPTGSKGASLAGHLDCPLALVPEPADGVSGPGPVVVGVDGSPASRAAIGFAFEEAAIGGTDVLAVEVRRPAEAGRPELIEESLTDLSEALAGFREKYPDVRVRREVLTGSPAPMLATVATRARCLVIGSRGLGGFRGLLFGSTGRALVHRCTVPLVIVRNGAPV
ncbi:universal stress protein [Kitasatospora cathayae]|uniref:Universal stress protein n=1 Tax=Kitasatospora cathayae TaxID=3004092 RepID=A0ABY7PWU7_9ACTN|nr:universal stress protein [Kitasatospora sp. HUAS 3-15]WBP84898.1 universal stress protein [Kitasatospora sp. HUAS 3-15]